MDMRIEAAPMEAEAQVVSASVTAKKVEECEVISLIERVASFSCPSVGGTSLSAVAPDHTILEGGLATAA